MYVPPQLSAGHPTVAGSWHFHTLTSPDTAGGREGEREGGEKV